MEKKISLREAVRFHGHLGPYLVLGLLAGEAALEKLKLNKYFGLEVLVWGAGKKPKSCLIDGLQLSTGATYGKGNIHKFNGPLIKIEFRNEESRKRLVLKIKKGTCARLAKAKTHRDCEALARRLFNAGFLRTFDSKLTIGEKTWRFRD